MMKTRHDYMRWLGLVLMIGCFAFAGSTDAKKGGGGKPPPEPPPPEGPAYQLIAVDSAGFGFYTSYPGYPNMISDSGALVGRGAYVIVDESSTNTVWTPAVYPPRIVGGEVKYVSDDIVCFLNVYGVAESGTCFAMNEAGIAVGALSGPWRAYLWQSDGTAIPVLSRTDDVDSAALDINNTGCVLMGVNQPTELSGVVVPLDQDGDGAPDTWFEDGDGDGVNDLFFLIDAGHNFNPLVINEYGQVVVYEYPDGASYLLTPDSTDADGDGNPWYADADGDGFNDLLATLVAPDPATAARAVGLNNLGQVVGTSEGHLVRWDLDGNGDLSPADLGLVANAYRMDIGGISDSGRMAGVSRVDAGRRSKSGPWWVTENDTIYELFDLLVDSPDWSGDLLLRQIYHQYYGINRYDWIVGRAHYNGYLQMFVAVPVEQP